MDAYPDATVTGYIRDTDARKNVLDFTVDKKGKVSTKSNSVGDIRDLEKYIDDKYYDALSGIEVSIELSESKSRINFYVKVNGSKYGTKWDSLKESTIERFMEKIAGAIEDEMGSIAIEGVVYDTHYKEDLAEYTVTSSGKASFKKY